MASKSKSSEWDKINESFILPNSLSERAEIFNKYSNNPEYNFVKSNCDLLHFAYNILYTNGIMYLNSVKELNTDSHKLSMTLIDSKYHDRVFQNTLQMSRLFINYLSSVGMVIDITRRVVNCELELPHISESYSEQTKKLFGNLDEAHFFKSLRNYALHRKVAVTELLVVDNRIAVYFITDEFKTWSKIPNTVLNFIKSIEVNLDNGNDGHGLELEALIKNYSNVQQKMVAWLMLQIIDQFDDIVSENNKFLKSLRT